MPAQATNGSSKTVLEMDDGETFLFTSESVGEGHPGKKKSLVKKFCVYYFSWNQSHKNISVVTEKEIFHFYSRHI